jgi:peptide/nickel transport system substrate-binding protein
MSSGSLSRRGVLATVGAFAATSIAPAMADNTLILKTRSSLDVAVLDPPNRISVTDGDVMRAIFSGLVRLKPGDTWQWENDIAVSIEQVDPTHITFQLRPGVPWTNGFGQVTAEDVKFSYERYIDPTFKAAYRTDWESLDHVEITDTHSGVIVLKRPFVPLWASTLPAASGMIVCKKAVEALDGKRFTMEPPATSGPYKIKKLEPRRSVTLERNPLWPGKPPAFDEIQYIQIVDANAAELAFSAGEVDFTQLPLASIGRVRKSPPAHSNLQVLPALAYWWLGMQSEAGVFSDIRVRRAVQYAVDVDAVLEGAFFGAAERATGIIAPSLIGHRPANRIDKPDPGKARDLLAQAGSPNGFKTTLGVRNSSEFVNAAQIVAASLANIGITAEIIPMEASAQRAMAIDRNGAWKQMGLHILRFTMQPDPSWATAWFVTSQIGEWNWERFSNPEFDRLDAEAKSELDRAKRAAMYVRMQDLMEDSGSYVFLTHGSIASIYRDTIRPALSPDGQFQIFTDFAPA